MPNISTNASLEDNVDVQFPLDNAIFRDPENYDEKRFLPDLATPYLPPYLNPSRYPTVFQNSSNSTFEVLFQFTPTLSNLLILACLATCTIWVIVMNLIIIGALLKGHKREKEHVTDMYLINLLFADVLLGIFVFPFMSMVILIGYFPLSPLWCNLWVYFDYYLIIASSYGFAALMTSYLLILRWPEYYPRSRKLHFLFIVVIWILSNAPWTAPFINDRVFVLYPTGVCGFSIQKNKYFTLYIGFTGFYIPLVIALLAGIFAVKYLKQSVRESFFKLLMNTDSGHVHPFIPVSASADYSERFSVLTTCTYGVMFGYNAAATFLPFQFPMCGSFYKFNDLYRIRRGNARNQVQNNFLKPPSGLFPSELPSESTESSESPIQKKRHSIINVPTFHRTQALQDSVKKHFPLVATSLILFVLSRSLFYTYFGIGSVVPKLFPPDLSHSVYWVMHSYAVLAPVVHLLLDNDLRSSVARFINEGTFELSPFSIRTAFAAEKAAAAARNHHSHSPQILPKVSVIDAPSYHHHHQRQHHHHHHHLATTNLNDSNRVRTHRDDNNEQKTGHYV